MRSYIKRETAQARAYSQAVITEGGRIVWLAGQVGAADATGRSLAGDFDGQVHEVFARFRQTLEEAGGSLADMVTMTVFIAAPGTETLPVRMFLYIQDNIDPLVTSVSACVIAITVIGLVALDRAYGLERLLVGRGQDGR